MPSTLVIISLSVFLALLPAVIWGTLFLYKQDEKRSEVIKIFLVGGTMVIPLMVYRFLWGIYPEINVVNLLKPFENKEIVLTLFSNAGNLILPLGILIMFLTIGVIEEFLKNIVARGADRKQINSVGDAVSFCIIAALGFAFVENTFYFMHVWRSLGYEMLFKVFIFRSIFSTFAHVLFSAVYGYHFGLALFAHDIYKQKKAGSLSRRLITTFSRITRIKSIELFENQQMLVGLIYAATLHAIFNVFLELNITQILIPFLVIGVIHVLLMIRSAKNNVEYK